MGNIESTNKKTKEELIEEFSADLDEDDKSNDLNNNHFRVKYYMHLGNVNKFMYEDEPIDEELLKKTMSKFLIYSKLAMIEIENDDTVKNKDLEFANTGLDCSSFILMTFLQKISERIDNNTQIKESTQINEKSYDKLNNEQKLIDSEYIKFEKEIYRLYKEGNINIEKELENKKFEDALKNSEKISNLFKEFNNNLLNKEKDEPLTLGEYIDNKTNIGDYEKIYNFMENYLIKNESLLLELFESIENEGLMTYKSFKKLAYIIHVDRYNYYGSYDDEHIISNKPIDIDCPTHGIFVQTPQKHLNGMDCPECLLRCKICTNKSEGEILS